MLGFEEVDLEKQLHIAAHENNIAKLAEILSSDEEFDISAKDEKGNTPLHTAIEKGHTLFVAALLKDEYIDVNATDDKGTPTPLHLAVRRNKNDIVKLLLDDHRILVNETNSFMATALHYAAYDGNLEAVIALLQAKNIDVNPKDHNKNVPLHLCSDPKCFQQLLIAGASIDATNNEKATPLLYDFNPSELENYSNILTKIFEVDTLLNIPITNNLLSKLSCAWKRKFNSTDEIVKFILEDEQTRTNRIHALEKAVVSLNLRKRNAIHEAQSKPKTPSLIDDISSVTSFLVSIKEILMASLDPNSPFCDWLEKSRYHNQIRMFSKEIHMNLRVTPERSRGQGITVPAINEYTNAMRVLDTNPGYFIRLINSARFEWLSRVCYKNRILLNNVNQEYLNRPLAASKEDKAAELFPDFMAPSSSSDQSTCSSNTGSSSSSSPIIYNARRETKRDRPEITQDSRRNDTQKPRLS